MIEYVSLLDGFSKTLFYISFGTGIIFIFQTIMMFFGIGDGVDSNIGDIDTDFDIDSDHAQHDVGRSFGWLSFKNVINFLLIFSITGLISIENGLSYVSSISIAILSGIGFVILMIILFNMMKSLSQDNTPKINDLIGKIGTVYLKIPKDGAGKIKITHGSAIKFLDATSENKDIPRDSIVKVIKILGDVIVVEEIK
jgi:membrane protein implicated in regulation of membrane protease activity